MPEAILRAKLTGDNAEFQRSMREGMASAREFSQELGARIREALVTITALTIGVEGVKDALDKTFEGIKGVFELSKELEHLSDRTGMAVRDLVNLQTEFKLSGLEADQVGQRINKMQQSIENAADKGGTAAEAFTRIGLNLHELQQMDPAAQFEAIRAGIAGIQDPARRSQEAMELFGKSGGEMLALFRNGNIGKEAANALGGQADILARNSEVFNQVTSDMEAAGIKIQGFFVGLAEPISHVILPVLNELESVDLTKWGATIGNSLSGSVRVLYNSFEDGKLSEVVGLAMKASFQESGNFLAGVLKADAMAFGDVILDTFNADFAGSIAAMFDGVAMQFGGALLKAISGPLSELQETLSYEFDKHDAGQNMAAAIKNAGAYDAMAVSAFKREADFRSKGNDAAADRYGRQADVATSQAQAARETASRYSDLRTMGLSDYLKAHANDQATFFGQNAGDMTNLGKSMVSVGEAGLKPIVADAVAKAMADVSGAQSVNLFGDSASKKLADLFNQENKPIAGEGKSDSPDVSGTNFDFDAWLKSLFGAAEDNAGSTERTVSHGRGVSGFHKDDDGAWSYYAGQGHDAMDFHKTGAVDFAGRTKESSSESKTHEVIQKLGTDISAIKSSITKITATA